MTPSQFVTEMVTLLDQPRAPAPIASPPHHQASEGPLRAIEGPLSPREQEVLQLVASGLTNKQIADRLIISVATVNYHVTSVLTKLCAENRTQAVSLATQQGIL